MKLYHCSSLDCSNYDCDYCRHCSHALYFGEGLDKNGKKWTWTYSPQFGPLFLRKHGEPLVNQPEKPDHPCWKPFLEWMEEK